jgi:hypothetical protein
MIFSWDNILRSIVILIIFLTIVGGLLTLCTFIARVTNTDPPNIDKEVKINGSPERVYIVEDSVTGVTTRLILIRQTYFVLSSTKSESIEK